jgi:hypothetical protein
MLIPNIQIPSRRLRDDANKGRVLCRRRHP